MVVSSGCEHAPALQRVLAATPQRIELLLLDGSPAFLAHPALHLLRAPAPIVHSQTIRGWVQLR